MDALGEMGISEMWVLANAIGDRYLFDPLPDMVIGILNPQAEVGSEVSSEGLSNLDVMLRVGRSAERGVPTILIIPPPLTAPSLASGVVFALCPPDNGAALRLHLWAFTSTINSSLGRASRRTDPEPHHIEATKFLQELSQSPDVGGQRFEEMVSLILRQAGAASVKSESYIADNQVDLAFVTSDDSSSVVLAEVKYGKLSEQRLRQAEQQLQGYVIERQADLGLVIYHDAEGRQ
jgi:hypothetical protein